MMTNFFFKRLIGIFNLDLIKGVDIEKTFITFRFNWGVVLLYAFFICYGFYGALSPPYEILLQSPFIFCLNLFFILGIAIFLELTLNKWSKAFEDSISISLRDIFILISLFFLLGLITIDGFMHSLHGDELSYVTNAIGHSIRLLMKFDNGLDFLGLASFNLLSQIACLFFLLGLIFFIWLTNTCLKKYRFAFIFIALIAMRLVIACFGGNGNPHPPLGGLPPLLFGVLLGINDVAMKLSYFTIFVFFIFCLYRVVSRALGWQISLLFVFAVGTVPLLLHMSTIVENSLFGSICLVLVTTELAVNKNPNLIRLASFISIATLFRETSFIAYVPVLFLGIYQLKCTMNFLSRKDFYLLCIPSFIFLPFLLWGVYYGTPATSGMVGDVNFIGRIFDILKSQIIFIAIFNALGIWAFFIPLSILYTGQKWPLRTSYAILFIACITMYYSIKPTLFGFAKYQAEYALPFAVCGLLALCNMATHIKFKNFLICLLLMLIGINFVDYYRLPKKNKPADIAMDAIVHDSKIFDSGYRVYCALVFDYKTAFNEIKRMNFAGNTYSVGANYGVLPQIFAGYSFDDIKQSDSIYRLQKKLNLQKNIEWDSVSIENVESDPRIKVVVLGAVHHRDSIIDSFLNGGWVINSRHFNFKYGSSVIVMRRPGE